MRVLIVEDEKKLALALAEGLRGCGYAVDVIMDGEKAYKRIILYRNEYDIIILDLMLPGMDGREICRRSRELGVQTPILVLTARNEVKNKVDVLHMGADDYMIKPFSFDELLARIQALLRRPENVKPVILTAQNIRLDTGTRTAYRDNQVIDLTLKEFALLEFFMRNPQRALNREEILDHVWDFEFLGFSNIVDVHVKNLRKKLDDSKGEVISTVRGVGYRLHN